MTALSLNEVIERFALEITAPLTEEITRLQGELDERIDTDLAEEIRRLRAVEEAARSVAGIEAIYTEELHWAMLQLRYALKVTAVPLHPYRPDRRFVL